ncbi:MAG: hypothetical protein ACP5SJ_03730 [Candidatus Micrarchaeia archaeon]
MDRRETGPKVSGYNEELEKEKGMDLDISKEYIEEDGAKVRMPYRMVKKVVFLGVKREELKDQPHAARLQYRLMLLEPVIKAYVNFAKGQITVIYNPVGADNIKDKMSLKELIEFLAKEGVNVSADSAKEEDFDYYKNFYSYAFNPSRIREHPPYGLTMEEWKKRKPAFEKEAEEQKASKWQKFLEWQQKYKKGHPEILSDME